MKVKSVIKVKSVVIKSWNVVRGKLIKVPLLEKRDKDEYLLEINAMQF